MSEIVVSKRLGFSKAGENTVVEELVFCEWKWYVRIIARDTNELYRVPVSVHGAVEFITEQKQLLPPELEFQSRFGERFLVYSASERFEFDPATYWTLVGVGSSEGGWNGDTMTYKSDEWLFNYEEAWLIIRSTFYCESGTTSDPTFESISVGRAADWCVSNGVEIPYEIRLHSAIKRLTPARVAAIARRQEAARSETLGRGAVDEPVATTTDGATEATLPVRYDNRRDFEMDQWVYETRKQGITWPALIEALGGIGPAKEWPSVTTEEQLRKRLKRFCLAIGENYVEGKRGNPVNKKKAMQKTVDQLNPNSNPQQ